MTGNKDRVEVCHPAEKPKPWNARQAARRKGRPYQ